MKEKAEEIKQRDEELLNLELVDQSRISPVVDDTLNEFLNEAKLLQNDGGTTASEPEA